MREERLARVLAITGAVILVITSLVPVMYMFVISVSETIDFASNRQLPVFTLGNYRHLMSTPGLHFLDYLRNSFIVSLVSSVVTVGIAALAAYALTRFEVRRKQLLLLAVLAVSLFPQISLVSYLFKSMSAMGWINTYQGLILPYVAWTLPLSLWILVSYFARIPLELDRAAFVDGCSYWQTLTRVILPVARPGIISAVLLAFIFAFNEFMFAMMLTTDYHARTIPVGIALFQGLHGEIPWGTIMAAAALSIIPVIAITTLFQRYILSGLTQGAVKG